MKIREGVAVIIFTKIRGKKRFLLLRRKLYWTGWEWLKGGRKKNESELFCLEREIEEETGKKADEYKIKKTGFIHSFMYQRPFVHDGVLWEGAKNHVYAAEFCDSKINLDKDEHSAFRWVSKKDALKMITYPDQKKIFEKVIK